MWGDSKYGIIYSVTVVGDFGHVISLGHFSAATHSQERGWWSLRGYSRCAASISVLSRTRYVTRLTVSPVSRAGPLDAEHKGTTIEGMSAGFGHGGVASSVVVWKNYATNICSEVR